MKDLERVFRCIREPHVNGHVGAVWTYIDALVAKVCAVHAALGLLLCERLAGTWGLAVRADMGLSILDVLEELVLCLKIGLVLFLVFVATVIAAVVASTAAVVVVMAAIVMVAAVMAVVVSAAAVIVTAIVVAAVAVVVAALGVLDLVKDLVYRGLYGLACRCNASYNRGRSALDISNCVYALDRGFVRICIHDRPALLVHRYAVPSEGFAVCMFANCGKEDVARDLNGLFSLHRSAPSRGIGLAKGHLGAYEPAVSNLLWICKEHEINAVFLGKEVLLMVCRHLLLSPSVDDCDVLHALGPLCSPCTVHCGVSTTCDDDVSSNHIKSLVVLERFKELKCTDYGLLVSLYGDSVVLFASNGVVDELVPCILKGLYCDILKLDAIVELHTMGCYEVDVSLNGLWIDPERWDYVRNHTACVLLALEDGGIET